jgi:4-hydroxybenzoate polyprenyltransferase
MGYFKDISADKETGYRTFPVVFGWLPTAVYSDLTAISAAFLTGWAMHSTDTLNIFGVGIFVAALVINVYAQIKIHQTRDEKKAHGPIANVVRSFILYCAAIVVTLKIDWMVFIVVFYFLFELALKFRPEKTQV